MLTTTTATTMTTRNMSSTSVTGKATDTDTATMKPKAKTMPAAAAPITTKTTVTSDPGILCFHHCNVKVFCFTLPHICPQCKTPLAATHSNGYGGGSRSGNSGNHAKRDKNKTIMIKKNNKISNSSNSGNNADHSDPIDSNQEDDTNNHQHNHQQHNRHHHYDHHHRLNDNDSCNQNNDDENSDALNNFNDENDKNDDDNNDDDDDDDDINRNSLTSRMMGSRLLPFRLPYPFVRANQYPCAIVLRPTTGDFLNDYNNTTDLHIAVTTSNGCVVEFDRQGLRRHRTTSHHMAEWWQCLLVGDVPEPWYDYWDQVLFEICQQPDKWTVSHYNEDKHNCYTFVLTFLQALTYDKLSEAATSKTRFCEKYIVPRTTTAGKYISLYRKLRDAGIYVHHTNHHKVRYAKQGKQLHQQQQQLQQRNFSKSNGLPTAIATTTTMTKNCLLTTNKHQQQQHLNNHHNHHSIISRPHSTLCTIEE